MEKFKYNPKTGRFEMVKVERPEDDIRLMSQMPARSGWIKFMHNRVNMNSVGNKHYSVIMWFDRSTGMVSPDRTGTDAVHFRSFMLPHAGRPGGWMPVNGPRG